MSGFARPELGSKPLAGTVKKYSRHVFLCYKTPAEWPSKVEDMTVPGALAKAIAAVDARKEVKLTLCDAAAGTADGDVLLFPEMVRFPGAVTTAESAAKFVSMVLSTDPAIGGLPLDGSFAFICAHAARDARCGECGPALVAAFTAVAKTRTTAWAVHRCSHVGGHEYAGNVVVFGRRGAGKVFGDWYGYVTPDAAGPIIDLEKVVSDRGAAVLPRLWRGRMGVSEEEHTAKVAKLLADVPAAAGGCGCAGATGVGCACGAAGGACACAAAPAKAEPAVKTALELREEAILKGSFLSNIWGSIVDKARSPIMNPDRPKSVNEFFNRKGVVGYPRYYELMVTAVLMVFWLILYVNDPKKKSGDTANEL